jgi:hypothetical protein
VSVVHAEAGDAFDPLLPQRSGRGRLGQRRRLAFPSFRRPPDGESSSRQEPGDSRSGVTLLARCACPQRQPARRQNCRSATSVRSFEGAPPTQPGNLLSGFRTTARVQWARLAACMARCGTSPAHVVSAQGASARPDCESACGEQMLPAGARGALAYSAEGATLHHSARAIAALADKGVAGAVPVAGRQGGRAAIRSVAGISFLSPAAHAAGLVAAFGDRALRLGRTDRHWVRVTAPAHKGDAGSAPALAGRTPGGCHVQARKS